LKHIVTRLFDIDARSLSACRLGFGLLILWDLSARWLHAEFLYGPQGLLTHSLLVHQSLIVFSFLSALSMTLGFYTRTSTFLTWALMLLLHRHNPAILDVGDSIIRLCLFWLSFLPTGSVWSWDTRHSPERSHKIPLLAAMGLLLQVAFLIFFAGLAKLEGSMWRDGLAVQYALGDALWALPLGKWLHEQPNLCRLLTWFILFAECLAPLLLFLPWKTHIGRIIAFSMLCGMFSGLGMSLNLGLISFAMIIALFPFIPKQIWPVRFSISESPKDISIGNFKRGTGILRDGILTLLLGYILLSNIDQMGYKSFLPSPVDRLGRHLRFNQGWWMYAPEPNVGNYTLTLRAQLKNGRLPYCQLDKLSTLNTKDPWPQLEMFSRNYRLRMYLYENVALYPGSPELNDFLKWIVQHWNSRTDSDNNIISLSLMQIYHVRSFGPGSQPTAPSLIAIWPK